MAGVTNTDIEFLDEGGRGTEVLGEVEDVTQEPREGQGFESTRSRPMCGIFRMGESRLCPCAARETSSKTLNVGAGSTGARTTQECP